MSVQISKASELIAGYSLEERIGSGGYGEVWRAEAPGGLLKAVKIIYGRFDEQRASCELKALHRIKEVRHPFLLSLERIEIIEGQLVIVTELAEASLSDRFEACKAAGLSGIPRDELLTYLHDAADALDYMSEHFMLQHLDIKPENLLILGGRVKVADFGLVKDVQDVTMSMMGGMTPVYAAPEVFNGHPSLQSDQYSLGIVYQEMLSGVLPFPGKTPAQLTNQHLHGHPRLTPLPTGDRPIIARALDKEPQQRYGHCRELIEALQGAEQAVAAADSTPVAKPKMPSGPVCPTITFSNADADNETASQGQQNKLREEIGREGKSPSEADGGPQISGDVSARRDSCPSGIEPDPLVVEQGHVDEVVEETGSAADEFDVQAKFTAIASCGRKQDSIHPLTPPAPVFEDLPCWEEPFTEERLRPAFLVGVGGIAARVLQHLQHRWQERFGNLEEIPIFQSLLLDTDPQTIEKISLPEDPASRHIDWQHLPLRKFEDYRDKTDQIMRWLGHRWIYNIPRSLRTEGLRPLGRLAFVDHAREISARIGKALKKITSPDAIESSSRQTEMPIPDSAPLIYLVASISGGTGSGMILDLAFLVRQALAREGISSARICGILLHGTSRHADEKKLAVANSYACLRELHAYQRKYPGEAASGIPSTEGRGPFDDTYFVHLGDDLSDGQFGAAAEKIGDYVYLDTATACREFFARCRNSSDSFEASAQASAAESWNLRTVGFSRIGFSADTLPADDIECLCQNLVEYWRQSSKKIELRKLSLGASQTVSPPNKADAPGPTTATRCHAEANPILDAPALSTRIEEALHAQVYVSEEAALENRLAKSHDFSVPAERAESTVDRAEKTLEALFETLQSLYGNKPQPSAADEPILAPLRTLVAEEGLALQERLLNEIKNTDGGLPVLQKSIDGILRELHDRECDAALRLTKLREVIAEAEPLLLQQTTAEKKSWFRRLFAQDNSSLAPQWKDYVRWRLESIVLAGQRYLWHELHEGLLTLNDRLRDLREELQMVPQMFHAVEPRRDSAKASGSAMTANLLDNTWKTLLHKHEHVLTGQLDRRLRGKMLAESLAAAVARKAGKIISEAWMDTLRMSVRQEFSDLLREIDLPGLILSSREHPANTPSPLRVLLDQTRSPLYATCGGGQRLLVACPKDAGTGSVKQKIGTEFGMPLSIAHSSSPEIAFCQEIERVPPLGIAVQLLKDQDDCREIASKLHARIDVSWLRDF